MSKEDYTLAKRVDDILDKISKYGVDSLSITEREFLDSHSIGKEEETHTKIIKQESETLFEDYFGLFKFEHSETEDYGYEIHYIGVIYVPDLILKNGKKINGRLEGRIVSNIDGTNSPDFYYYTGEGEDEYYDIFEFCTGVEYEFDNFIDYVVLEISNRND